MWVFARRVSVYKIYFSQIFQIPSPLFLFFSILQFPILILFILYLSFSMNFNQTESLDLMDIFKMNLTKRNLFLHIIPKAASTLCLTLCHFCFVILYNIIQSNGCCLFFIRWRSKVQWSPLRTSWHGKWNLTRMWMSSRRRNWKRRNKQEKRNLLVNSYMRHL